MDNFSGFLRPPKRHGEESGSEQSPKSPKRPRPSPEFDYPSPNFGSEPPSSELENDTGTEIHCVSNADSSSHLDGVMPMDWDPTDSDLESADPRICYGAICDARARFEPPGRASKLISQGARFCVFDVVSGDTYHALFNQSNEVVACLDSTTGQALRSLGGLAGVSFKAVIESVTVTQSRKRAQTSKGIVPLSINVYGPVSRADQVGKMLSAASAFLQHPFFLEPSCNDYFNPQLFRIGNEMQNLTHLVGLTEQDLRAKAISQQVEHIFESLDDLPFLGDGEFQSQFHLDSLHTQLKDHQLAALRFIQGRENQGYCQTLHKRLRDLTKLPSQLSIPSYLTGGILADVMGLGKTLTMISAIISTLEASRQYRSRPNMNETLPIVGATLIVVSSVQVLNVWETEIQRHVKRGTLKLCNFHGKGRPRKAQDLADYDVVLTTYGVTSTGFKKQSVLHSVDWYRVVLDEAHWIRNRGSNQFKAAASLHSPRRWCLTGTPIQNSLDDLVSLLSFLHFEPFSSHTVFKQHILEPLRNDNENGGLRLRELLRTICLRRDGRLLNLPEPRYEQHSVALHETERELYGQILKQCARDIDDAVSSRVKIKKYSILFTAIIKLRRLCNHGTFSVPLAANPATLARSGSAGEDGCEFCNGDDEDKLQLVSQADICSECGRILVSTSSRGAAAVPKGFGDTITAPGTPLQGISPNTQPPISTKIQAVVGRLCRMEYGSKSLVFTYWTATLDLLEQHLRMKGISSLRIDGTVGYAARLNILETFKNSDVSVLLMTVQTGAVGLNLTTANYVHIVEPQWNPSVEEQAIARALRMGQTRTVTVVRYVVKNSVEENIVNLQKRKRNLAKFTLDSAAQEQGNGSLDDLRFMLDLDFTG